MPLYEFECNSCKNILQKDLPISDETKNITCPKCGGEAKKIISLSTFVLKGDGWYATEYKKKNKSKD